MKIHNKLMFLSLLVVQSVMAATKTVSVNNYTGQVVISEPGKYVLQNDVAVAPRTSNSAMVYITASDVLLDLNGKSLTLSVTNQMPVQSGIWIADGAENVTVTNGFIKGKSTNNLSTAYTSTGIYGNNITNVVIDRVIIDNCQSNGIILDHAWKPTISKTKVKNTATAVLLQASREGTLADLSLTQVNAGVAASNCNVWSLTKINVADLGGGPITGFSFDGCSKIVGTNLKVQNNVGSGEKNGFAFSNSNRCHFSLCDFLNNICDDGSNTITGFSLDQDCAENILERCTVRNNIDHRAGNEIYGFVMTGGFYNALLNCSVLDNTSYVNIYSILCDIGSTGPVGARVECCKVLNNTTDLPGTVYGVLARNLLHSTINGCEISGNGCFSPITVDNISAVAAITLSDACQNLRITNNLMVGNTAYAEQFGFIDQGSMSLDLTTEPTDSSDGIFLYGNSGVHQGPQEINQAITSPRSNFVICDLGSGYPATGYMAEFASEVVLDPSLSPLLPSTDTLELMPQANISIYVAGANGFAITD